MRSSVAIFSNHGDPFPPPMTRRTHYRPSQPQTLSEEQKQTVLSPVRLHHRLTEVPSPPDLAFLGESQRFVPSLPESDFSGPFNESWPSSEGSNKTPEQERMRTGPAGKMDDAADPTSEDSVIARYMERFRTGRPTSRQERSPPHRVTKEFWWLPTSPDSPDAPRLRPASGISADVGFSPQSLDLTPLAETSLNDSRVCPEDVDVLGLQERARKLILHSESSLSCVGDASSEGVGSSPSCASDVSGIRPSTLDKAPVVPVTSLALPSSYVRAAPPPEDDILYQWRLRRKMEAAREGTLPLSTRTRTPSPPVRIPKQVLVTVDSSEMVCRVPPAAERSHLAAHAQTPNPCCRHVSVASPHMAPQSMAAAVPPHLHLQCDVLPCGHSQPSTPPKPETPASPSPPADTAQCRRHKAACAQPTHRRSQRKADTSEERKAQSKGEKSKRIADKSGPKKVQGGPPPSSPVHQAMEQVISQRLFSPLQSPKRTANKRASAPHTEEEGDARTLGIAAHLLEEAEDSDGTEFGDDPLLHVLREQRGSLRSRLREVDLRLAELEGERR